MTNSDTQPAMVTVTATSQTTTTVANSISTSTAMSDNAITLHPIPTTITTTQFAETAYTITDTNAPVVFIPPTPTITETPSATVFIPIGAQETSTITQTSFAITYYFQDTAGSIYSTSTKAFLTGPTGTVASTQLHEQEDGFNGWSAGAKAGLIIGVVFAALILTLLLIGCYKRNARWIAHDWRWAPAVEGSAPAMANANMMRPGSVASPVTVVSTPSYGYGYPAYGYGLRGGAESKGWIGRLADRLVVWKNRKGKVEEGDDATPIRVLREMREAHGKQRDAGA